MLTFRIVVLLPLFSVSVPHCCTHLSTACNKWSLFTVFSVFHHTLRQTKAEHPAVTKATLIQSNNNNEMLVSRAALAHQHVWPAASRYLLFICPGSLYLQNHKRLKSSFKGPLAPFCFGEKTGNEQQRDAAFIQCLKQFSLQ